MLNGLNRFHVCGSVAQKYLQLVLMFDKKALEIPPGQYAARYEGAQRGWEVSGLWEGR